MNRLLDNLELGSSGEVLDLSLGRVSVATLGPQLVLGL